MLVQILNGEKKKNGVRKHLNPAHQELESSGGK